MNKFVELVQRAYQERYSVVISNVVNKKIPVAFFSIAPLETAIKHTNVFRKQGLNITNLITVTPPRKIICNMILTL